MESLIKKSLFLTSCLLFALSCFLVTPGIASPDFENPASGFIINEDGQNPLVFQYNGMLLNLINGLGPIIEVGPNDVVVPADYNVKLIDVIETDNGVRFNLQAIVDDVRFNYSLQLSQIDTNSVEVLASSDDGVHGFQIGNITGNTGPFKHFHTGERDLEAHFGNSNHPGIIYWPHGGLYFHAYFDASYSHGSLPRHRNPSRRAFIVNEPAISIDTVYGSLTDGSRRVLRERYLIRYSESLWDVYPQVYNNPTPYTEFFKNAVYLDGWFERFCYGKAILGFIEEAIPSGAINIITTIQHWAAWNEWDGTCPDSWEYPDHVTPWDKYGTVDELHEYIDMARTFGKVGLRQNYLWFGDQSWSYAKGRFSRAKRSSGEYAWFTNLRTVKPLLKRQESEVMSTFNVNAAFHDQWVSTGTGWPIINFDHNEATAGTISGTQSLLRDITTISREIIQGPLLSESMIAEFLYGGHIDGGDYCIFNAAQRTDFSPEYKLRRLHGLAMSYGMGLGYRHFYPGNWEVNRAPGDDKYFNSDIDLDSYRACTVLYGNGAYLFGKRFLRLSHVLTEFITVGLAQQRYAFQPVDFVRYSNGGRFRTLDQLIPMVSSGSELHSWYRRFHIRYANGAHVWVNLSEDSFDVTTPGNESITLGKNCWLVYTEEGDFIAYTAEMVCPVVAGLPGRVDYVRDDTINLVYANPRNLHEFMGVSLPTVWSNGSVYYELKNPNTTIKELCE